MNSAKRKSEFLEDFIRNPDKYDRKQVEAVFKVRTLADRIECLPDRVNSPSQMPFVQEALRVALERFGSDRNAVAMHFERDGNLSHAEELRQPVEFVPLLAADLRTLEEGFKRDESGIFEEIERDAAEIGEWMKKLRHPRDVEKFREYLKFVCDPSVLISGIGIEVRPGVFALDLDAWKAAGATPLCRYLRELADEIERFGGAVPTGATPKDDEINTTAKWLGNTKFQVGGGEAFLMPNVQGYVLQDAITLGNPFSAADIRKRSTNDEAPLILRQIRNGDSPLKPFIHCPGRKAKGGYRVEIEDCRST